MIQEGHVILFNFPQTDLVAGKMRPALIIRSIPDSYDDWLICMITTRLHHEIVGIDNVIYLTDPDFNQTGLKSTSLIRVTRLAVVSRDVLAGIIGKIHETRLERIRAQMCYWISDE